MPISLSFESLAMDGGEKLLPQDVRDLFAACLEAPADDSPKGALADLLDEKYQEHELCSVLRWLIREQKFPAKKSWGWGWAHSWEKDLPEHSRLPSGVPVSDYEDESPLKLLFGLIRDARKVRAMLPG